MRPEDFQKICLGIVEIKNYCQNHQCDFQCAFFVKSGCIFTQGIMPNKWLVPASIIKGMDCIEVDPEIETKQNDKINKEGDQNDNQ